MECKKETNLKNCNCSYNCEKKGICCECIKYHRERGELPACYFSNEEEKNYDRSIKNYFKMKSK
ncbi:MAG: hypothetical protein HON47_04980 [Candidatus Diapherotrites archaeon]|jgi:hypothetical protein|uniref:Cytosolic protein n=1 Tax=Candidatus Iainarchaeum sp. TaxID=3101447 RepID=A0A8T5GFJ4_9ARCH|nr:hypothetical protein [Candidatus Diapherotrites archaeon]